MTAVFAFKKEPLNYIKSRDSREKRDFCCFNPFWVRIG